MERVSFANRNFTSVFGDRTSFRAKGLHSNKRKSKSQFYFSFWRSNLISCERVAFGQASANQNRNFTSVFGDRTSFRAKGLRRAARNRSSTLAFGDRTSFRAKGLRPDPRNRNLPQFLAIELHFVRKGCVSCRLVGTAPRLQERNRKEGESKRAREQEGKRECKDVKMRR